MPRTAIISDIHANLHALCAVIEDVQAMQCTDVVCLGDIVGYNAYPKECLDYIRNLNCSVVKGNHDDEVVHLENTRMNAMARQAMEWTRSQLDEEHLAWLSRLQYQRIVQSSYTIVHSSLDFPKSWNYVFNVNDATANFRRQFSSLCFHGHTHVPRVFVWDGQHAMEDVQFAEALKAEAYVHIPLQEGYKYFINVGSVGQPRDRDPRACYAVFDSDARVVTFRRVAYDVEAARQAVLAAGLPEYLADRLLTGS